ncbi:MAG: ATP-binding protein [Proteobacteria bacterium]|nr:ATP-binding protein [Pseudomonadota bacterium]
MEKVGEQVALRYDPRTRTRLLWLMFARLLFSLASFGMVLGLDGIGHELGKIEEQGLYLSLAFAFLATALSGAVYGRIERPGVFASVQLAMDAVIVTSLVIFSGGVHSVFAFLYVLVSLYGAILYERPGALGAASLCALGYGLVVFAPLAEWLPGLADQAERPLEVKLGIWGVQAGAFFLVGILASVLAQELRAKNLALVRSDSEMRRLRELHTRTVDSIMSGLLTTDRAGQITSFNPEAERITGWTAVEAVGVDVDEVIPGVRALTLGRPSRDDPERTLRSRMLFVNRREESLHLGLAASILRDAGGAEHGHVIIFQDVTRVVAMEQDLRRSERLAAVGELAAKIAHEIRNPLASISGSVQILRGGTLDNEMPEEATRLMDIAVRETDRLNRLISDFLRYAKPSPIHKERIQVSEVVAEVTKLLQAVLPPDIEFDCACPPDLEVDVDPGQLRQILWNLCLNGVQAMEEEGRLGLVVESVTAAAQDGSPAGRNASTAEEAELGGEWVEISVSDTGPGIPPDVRARIFEPFFTTKREGTGLGLATAHRIIQGHGATLDVESDPGKGTVFRVRLPTREANS